MAGRSRRKKKESKNEDEGYRKSKREREWGPPTHSSVMG